MLRRNLGTSLKRSVCLGNKGGKTDIYCRFVAFRFTGSIFADFRFISFRFPFTADFEGRKPAGQINNGLNILSGLCGQTVHEVKLDSAPSQLKGTFYGIEDILFRNVFIDNITKSLGSGLRCNGKTCLFYRFNDLHQRCIQFVCSDRRQGYGGAVIWVYGEKRLHKRSQIAVISST